MAQVKKQSGGTLAADMRMLLETGDGADIALQAGSSCLLAHRAVLRARSPVFAAMFRHNTKESFDACVIIKDVEGKILRRALQFMYTGELPTLDRLTLKLLAAADKYQLTDLKESCEEWLMKNLTIKDAAAIAVLAVTHSLDQLKKAVVNYVRIHYLEIIGTNGWECALRNNVDAIVEICRLVSAAVTKRSRSKKTGLSPVRKQREEKNSLIHDFGKLLKSGEGADIMLSVSGSQLRAHRSVLSARSPVLASMLENVSGGSLDIQDVDKEVLQQILHFVYTDEAPSIQSMGDKLFIAAIKYDLPVLRLMCEEQLFKGLTVQNASSTAALAFSHVCPSLKKTVMNYMKGHFMQVISTPGWADLLWNNPAAAVTICQFAADSSLENRTKSDGGSAHSLRATLHDAAKCGDTSKVQVLLAAGAEVDAQDSHWRRTALHWASTGGHRDTVMCLLRRGAAVDMVDYYKRTPLHLAASCGENGTVQLLVAAGTDLNSRDNSGATPLHCAAEYDNAEVTRTLLQAGAYRDVKDAKGCTVFDVANACDSRQVIDMLRKYSLF